MARTSALEKPAIRAKAIGYIIDGLSDAEVAAALSDKRMTVTRQAITKFRHRHAAEIAPVVEQVEREITDYAIAQKVNRIRDAQLRRDLLDRVREIRAAGGDGMETGIVARQYKMVGSGENATLVEEYKVDTAFLAEWRANDRQVSDELDQMPRSGNTNINIDARRILVRYVEGAP